MKLCKAKTLIFLSNVRVLHVRGVGFLTTTADKKGINIYFFFETGGVQTPHPPKCYF
jgi:hypothetical protein